MSSEPIDYFKSDVREFDEIDSKIKQLRDRIKPINAEIKELMTKKKELQGEICTFMSNNDIDVCNLPDGKLEFKESKTVKPITKIYILEKLEEFFDKNYTEEFKKMNSEQKANTIHSFIYTEREYTPANVLRKKS